MFPVNYYFYFFITRRRAMARGLFNIGLNEHAPVIDENGKTDITSAINVEVDSESANKDIEEAQVVAETAASSLEEAGELQLQHDANQELIDKHPEQVTEEIVQVAQESFAFHLGRLGVNKQDFLNNYKKDYAIKVATESAKTPLARLKISNEGLGDFIAKLIQKVKDMFRGLGNIFRKIWLKFRKVFDGTKSKAESLLKKVNENAKYNVKGKSLDYVNDVFIGMQLCGQPFDIEAGSRILHVSVDTLDSLSSSLLKYEKDAKQDTEGLFPWLLRNSWEKSGALMRGLFGDKAIDFITRQVPSGNSKTIMYYVTKFMNRQLKLAALTPDKKSMEIISTSADKFPNIKEFSVTGKDLVKYLNIAKTGAENVGQYQARIESTVRNAQYSLNTIDKKYEKQPNENMVFALNILGRLSTSITIDLVSNYLDFHKGVVNFCSMLIEDHNPDNPDELKKIKEQEEAKNKTLEAKD